MILQNITNNTKRLIDKTYSCGTQQEKPHIILGLSGGPDSVFLLHVLKKLYDQGSILLTAAHLNHGWRKNADRDVAFCQQLAHRYNIRFITKHVKELSLPIKYNGSQEEVGRKQRRFFFSSIRSNKCNTFIALGHHQEDQQETFFLRLLRGSSLTGLTGMSEQEGYYLRPLLATSKSLIIDCLEKNHIDYLEDPTNNSDMFLRNKIRKYVIPALSTCDSRFKKKFASTLCLLKQDEILLKNITQQRFNKVFSPKSFFNNSKKTFTGCRTTFRQENQILQKKLILSWLITEGVHFQPSSGLIHEILRFLLSPRGGTHKISPQWIIKKKQNSFWIEKENLITTP